MPRSQSLRPDAPIAQRSLLARMGLMAYRATIVAVLVILVHTHRVRLQIDNDLPVTLAEVQPFLPNAVRLDFDTVRMGLDVLDAKRSKIGYAVRTQPACKDIIGYSGPTDAMLVFDANWVVRGVKIRRSRDTYTHFFDVSTDRYFLKSWEGKTWDQIAEMDLKKAGVEGVSGATLTSMAVARSFVFRLKNRAVAQAAETQPLSVRGADVALIAALLGALAIAFSKARGNVWLRGVWQVVLIVGIGVLNGQLLAVSLFSGWSASGVAWRNAPGLALLAAAALLVPWSSKKALYCQYFCPHGAAQEWLHRIAPARWRLNPPPAIAAALRWLPGLLLLFTLVVTMLVLPFELSDIEPFDAYVAHAWSWTMGIAVAGLIAALFVPMAYCKFGCPTGALLEFIRTRGPQDHFSRRDVAALFLVAATLWMYVDYDRMRAWIVGV